MCGIAGILHRSQLCDAPRRVQRMADALHHRGPDDEGFWSDANISLGFRRLAIVDIETGRQPMSNEDDTIHVIFNGEIYNHRELRRLLENAGHHFKSDHSDTEVIVHGYEEWGNALLDRLNGIYAFAVWDTRRSRLLLSRDRLGVKPMYFAERDDGALVFASEMRAITASRLIEHKPNDESVYRYFLQQNVWGDQTLFKGIMQLPAGHCLVDDKHRRSIRQFWDITFHRRNLKPRDAADALRSSIERTITRQMAADVPVMTYLSGGIDSSALVAGAQRLSPNVKAYSCIFDLSGVGVDRFVDEREFARAVALHLGIEHIELELSSTSLKGTLHRTVDALEEPRMGMAYVNYLIAERVALDSKVVLSGCGGDEILGGYVARYAHLRLGYPESPMPKAGFLERLRCLFMRASPRDTNTQRRMLELYGYPVPSNDVTMALSPDIRSAGGGYCVRDGLDEILKKCPSKLDWDRLLYADAKTYLAGLLTVEDKLSMAHSLESRVPLIDDEIVDLALGFGWSLLTDGRVGKKVFRDAIREWVPPMVADKPKMGFGPPDASWYRGPLQPWIRELLAPDRIAARGVFQPNYVATAIDQHMSGEANRIPLIWSLLSFDAWCETTGFYGGDLGKPKRPTEAYVD